MSEKIRSSEITDERVYFNRRNFLRTGILAGSAVVTGLGYRLLNPPPRRTVATADIEDFVRDTTTGGLRAELTSFDDITSYNNFYEFSTSKSAVASRAEDFVTRPWTVSVGGLVGKPTVFGIEDLLRFEQEERIYRFRCVEGWSMVIPWVGFPLKRLLDAVMPLGSARYIAFGTFYEGSNPRGIDVRLPKGRNSMQSGFFAGIPFPYVEGLRLDEALHPLTILASGIYGKTLPNQNGAPMRLVVPWKYGFKSIKSIVSITLTAKRPPTTWSRATPSEYGFYSNVNPNVGHPRWSQATERRIGELGKRKTLMFNGYASEVGSLYSGMDLRKQF